MRTSNIIWTFLVAITIAFVMVINLVFELESEPKPIEYAEKNCVHTRYSYRGLPEVLLLCEDGTYYDTSGFNPDRGEMLRKMKGGL
jgi:hypothetical protein